MLNDHDHGCGSVGRWISVLCAALGVVTAILMIRAMNIGWYVPGYPIPKEIAVGLVVLFIAAAFLGEKAGVRLCGRSHDVPLNVLVGQGVAFGSIAIAVMAGTLVGVVSAAGEILSSPGFTPIGVVLLLFGPLFLVLMFGGIPAVLLGLLYGFVVRNRLRDLDA